MEKNWLIRTKSNHILGPISKEKLRELYRNGSIKPDDEICSGNGFWFFVRENEFIEKYLLGDEVQGFNPVSEAKDVLESNIEDHSVDDITIVGNIDLKALMNNPDVVEEEAKVKEFESIDPNKDVKTEVEDFNPDEQVLKKKINNSQDTKSSKIENVKKNQKKKNSLRKQNYLKWLGILGFALLVSLIYFRKRIFRALIESEELTSHFRIIESSHAQEIFQKKKSLFETLKIDGIEFKPVVDLKGLKIISDFEIESLKCSSFTENLYKLAIVLYPPEFVTERFLFKLRECKEIFLKDEILKHWYVLFLSTQKSKNSIDTDFKMEMFLKEVIYSNFNLILDEKMKKEISNAILEIKSNDLDGLLLKSYLYLMIGNVAKSDSFLRKFFSIHPFNNWKRNKSSNIFTLNLVNENISQILKKLENHPSDRRVFNFFCYYLDHFYPIYFNKNEGKLCDTGNIEEEISKKIISEISPELSEHIKFSDLSKMQKISYIKAIPENDLDSFISWNWSYYLESEYINESLLKAMTRIEHNDPLKFNFILSQSNLVESYAQYTKRSPLSGKISLAKKYLNEPSYFMIALYLLLQEGYYSNELVSLAVENLYND